MADLAVGIQSTKVLSTNVLFYLCTSTIETTVRTTVIKVAYLERLFKPLAKLLYYQKQPEPIIYPLKI